MQGGDILARTEVAVIKNGELVFDISPLDRNGLQGCRGFRVVPGHEQIAHVAVHALGRDLQFPEGLADFEGMVHHGLGLVREPSGLYRNHATEDSYEEQDSPQSKAQLGSDFQVSQFHSRVIRRVSIIFFEILRRVAPRGEAPHAGRRNPARLRR